MTCISEIGETCKKGKKKFRKQLWNEFNNSCKRYDRAIPVVLGPGVYSPKHTLTKKKAGSITFAKARKLRMKLESKGQFCNQFLVNPTKKSDGIDNYLSPKSSLGKQLNSRRRSQPSVTISKSTRFVQKKEDYSASNFAPQPYSSFGSQTRAVLSSSAAPSFGIKPKRGGLCGDVEMDYGGRPLGPQSYAPHYEYRYTRAPEHRMAVGRDDIIDKATNRNDITADNGMMKIGSSFGKQIVAFKRNAYKASMGTTHRNMDMGVAKDAQNTPGPGHYRPKQVKFRQPPAFSLQDKNPIFKAWHLGKAGLPSMPRKVRDVVFRCY